MFGGLDMPDQNVKSLGEFAIAIIVVQFLLVTSWTVFFFSRDWELASAPGSRVVTLSESTVTGLAASVFAMQFFSMTSLIYGIVARDRGWLMFGMLNQMGMLSIVHVGYDNDGVRWYAAIVDVVILAGAWCSYRLQEKIQEEAHKKEKASEKKLWKCYDLPDQTATTMKMPIAGAGCAILIIGIILSATERSDFGIVRGITLLAGGLLSTLSSTLGKRRIHIFCFVYYVLLLAYVLSTLGFTLQVDANQAALCASEFYEGDAATTYAEQKSDCEALQGAATAASAFNYIAFVAIMITAWAHLRISEKIQEENETSVVLRKYSLCFFDMSRPVKTVGRVVFALMPLKLALMVSTFFVAASYEDEGIEAGMPSFHYTLGCVQLLISGVTLYATIAKDRGFFMFGIVLHSVVFSVAFSGLNHASVAVADRIDAIGDPPIHAIPLDQSFLDSNPPTDRQLSALSATVVLTLLTAIEGLIAAFLLVDMSEFVQEEWEATTIKRADGTPAQGGRPAASASKYAAAEEGRAGVDGAAESKGGDDAAAPADSAAAPPGATGGEETG